MAFWEQASGLEIHVRIQRMYPEAGVNVVAHAQEAEEGGSLA